MKKISACLGAVAAALLLFACAGCSEQTFTEKSYTSDENAVTQIAIDGIAVVVHKDSPLTNVTFQQLFDLYAYGTPIECE